MSDVREDDEDAQEVSRLLAAARHDEPTPPDVVARVTAALAAEATADRTGTSAPVVDLSGRRRQRRRTGLLAAAVVVVAGVGVGAVVLDGGLDLASDQDAAGGGSEKAEAPAPERPGAPGAPGAPGQNQDQDQDESAPDVTGGVRTPLPRVRTGPTLAADVVRALRTGSTLPAGRARCAPADAAPTAGEVVRVRADGGRAELLAGPARGGERSVSLYRCGSPRDGAEDGAGGPATTLVVPAP